MSTGADFVTRFSGQSQATWEKGAVDAALAGDYVDWPFVEVPLTVPPSLAGHTASVRVTSDVFSVGDSGNFLRLPLSPVPAQQIANLRGLLLPTRKIAHDIYLASPVKLVPLPQNNKGPNLPQYAEYDAKVQAELEKENAPFDSLISGHKKDVVIWRGLRPGKVAIYGWFKPDGTRIQPLSDVHDDHYADYSHGIRFVAPTMTIDGQTMNVEDVLRDPKLSAWVSDEGPYHVVRYPVPRGVPGSSPPSGGGGVAATPLTQGVLSWLSGLFHSSSPSPSSENTRDEGLSLFAKTGLIVATSTTLGVLLFTTLRHLRRS